MSRSLDTSFFLPSEIFSPEHVKIRILGHFLIVEAEMSYGMKGVNLTKHNFKSCLKLRKNVDVPKIRAFLNDSVLRVTTFSDIRHQNELLIDKRQAYVDRRPAPKFPSEHPGNYERFVEALKAVGMI